MLRLMGLAVVVGVLVGCAQQPKIEEFRQAQSDVKARCDAGQYQTKAEQVKCFNDGIVPVFQAQNHPYMDLVSLTNAYRLVAAERVDKGEITEAEAEVIMGEVIQRVTAESHRRDNEAGRTRAAQQQGVGAVLQGLGAWNRTYAPLQRSPITCFDYGDIVRCQ